MPLTTPASSSPGERPYLFVVDDDPDQLRLVEMAVKKSSAFPRLQTAVDSQLAYERLIQGAATHDDRPDLILIDWKMPRMHGSALACVLREHPELRFVPLVVLSSSTNERDRATALDSGCREYYEKPAHFSDLVTLMGMLRQLYGSVESVPKTTF